MFKWISILLFLPFIGLGQEIDHWETVLYNDVEWRYFLGNQEPEVAWKSFAFNDQSWEKAIGGIGYGDNDDNTIISPTISLYIRTEFTIYDKSTITLPILSADYDDGFIAYLNGVEIARKNMKTGDPVLFDDVALSYHEASLYQGALPEKIQIENWVNILKVGTNVLAIQVHNHAANSSDLSSNFFLHVGVINETEQYQTPPDWFEADFLFTTLPIIKIQTVNNEAIKDEPKIPATMQIMAKGNGQLNSEFDAPNDYNGSISIEIRGSSSQMFPKKNYGFETQKSDGTNNNISLIGLPAENDWILHGPYADKSLLRNVLGYYISSSTGQYAPRTRLTELLVNDEYLGVYVLTERIKRDKNRVDISKLNKEDIYGDELTGGYILQIDRDNPFVEDDGWYSAFPDWKFYAFDDPDYDELAEEQKDYIESYMYDFEEMMNSPGYDTLCSDFIDIDSWVDYFLANEMAKHIDAFKLSFFMYKDKDSKNEKLQFGPIWDLNLGFGNFDFDCSPDPEGWAYEFRATCASWHPFWVPKLVEIPAVENQINCRWNELRAGPWSNQNLIGFLNSKASQLENAQVRNFEKWPILGTYVWPNNFIGESYDQELYFLTFWFIERLAWMDDNMLGDCNEIDSTEIESVIYSSLKIYPNPSFGPIRIEYPGKNLYNLEVQFYDAYGHLIHQLPINSAKTDLDLSNFSQGVYIYKFRRGERLLETGKLTIL